MYLFEGAQTVRNRNNCLDDNTQWRPPQFHRWPGDWGFLHLVTSPGTEHFHSNPVRGVSSWARWGAQLILKSWLFLGFNGVRHFRWHTLKNPADASKWRSPCWMLMIIFYLIPTLKKTLHLIFSSSSRGLCDPTQCRNEHSTSLVVQFPFCMFLLCWASFWHFGGQQFCSKYYICTCWRHVPLYFSGRYGKKF